MLLCGLEALLVVADFNLIGLVDLEVNFESVLIGVITEILGVCDWAKIE